MSVVPTNLDVVERGQECPRESVWRRAWTWFCRPLASDRSLLRERPFPGAVFYIWSYPFTAGGKLIMGGLLVSALVGSITNDIPIYQLPVALLVLVLLVSAVGSVLRWLSVKLTGEFPDVISAGQTVRAEFTVTNDNRLPLFDVSVACFSLPRSFDVDREERIVTTLSAGESAKLTIKLTPRRRGLYDMPSVRAFSTFPFNLFRNQLARKESRPLLVLPRFEPLSRLHINVANRYQPGGVSFAAQVGESPEYIGNREYMPGDSPRHIDFRSWARLSKPVVREFQEEYFHRVGLILDTHVPCGPLGLRLPWQRRSREFEAAVSLTASVAHLFSQGEFLLDVFAAGPDIHVFRIGRNTPPLPSVLEILAAVPDCPQSPFDGLTAALINEFPYIAAVVCIFLDWDASRYQIVRAALDSGCQVKVVLIERNVAKSRVVDSFGVELVRVTAAQVEAGLGEF